MKVKNCLKILGLSLIFVFLFVPTLVFAQEKDIKIAVMITEGTASDNSNSKISLQWNKIDGVSGYQVSFSTDGQNWVILAENLNDTAWEDSQERKDYMNYFYKVSTVTSNEEISKIAKVFPPNTNAHANYIANPGVCKNCHTTHKSMGENLLKEATAKALCETCHIGNTGSKYDIKAGQVLVPGGNKVDSLAGPFGGTSKHDLLEIKLKAPGGKDNILNCTSCHNGHDTGNYRNLRYEINDSKEIRVKARAVTQTLSSGEKGFYASGYSNFCSSCHGDYMRNDSGSGRVKKPEQEDAYLRHTIGVGLDSGSYAAKPLTSTLPMENNKIMCGTCHMAHGTKIKGDNVSEIKSNGVANNNGLSTMLKRRPEMGVCQDCHKK